MFTVVEWLEENPGLQGPYRWVALDQWGTPWKGFRTLRAACAWVVRGPA